MNAHGINKFDRPVLIVDHQLGRLVSELACDARRPGFEARCRGARLTVKTSVSQSGPYRSSGGLEVMQGSGRRVRLEWGAYITV
ncbi:hypothetical protein FHG87_013097 [Trinorchestia longiramus]|nr:hypothetical protein FHG87_013097 [Trinorchestia longiramus]